MAVPILRQRPAPSGSGLARGGGHMYDQLVRQIAAQLGVSPDIIPILLKLMQTESGGNPGAINPNGGATGLFQILPGLTRNLRAGMDGGTAGFDPKSPTANATQAVTWIKRYLKRFGGDIRLAIAAHHDGPENVANILKQTGDTGFTPDVFTKLSTEAQGQLKAVFGPDVAKGESVSTSTSPLQQGQTAQIRQPGSTGVPQLDTATTNPPPPSSGTRGGPVASGFPALPDQILAALFRNTLGSGDTGVPQLDVASTSPAPQGVDPTAAPLPLQITGMNGDFGPLGPQPGGSIASRIAGNNNAAPQSAPQSAQASPAQPVGGGQPTDPRSGVGILGSLIGGAPAQYMPIPQPQGNKWYQALPGLGAAVGNAFAGASMVQQQKGQETRAQAESAASIAASNASTAASKQRMMIEQGSVQDSFESFYADLPPVDQAKLIREHATPAELAADLNAGNAAEFNRKRGLYGSRQEAENMASANAVFADPTFRTAFGWKTPEDAMNYVKAGKPSAQLWQIMQAKSALEMDVKQSQHLLNIDNANISSQVTDLQNARAGVVDKMNAFVAQQDQLTMYTAMEAKLNDPNLPEAQRKSIQNSMLMAGVQPGTINPAQFDNTINGYKALITDYESRIKKLDPTATITSVNPGAKAPTLADALSRLDSIFKVSGSKLSPEDTALADQVGKASAARLAVLDPLAKAVTGYSMSDNIQAGKALVNVPAAAVGGVIAPFEAMASAAGAYDRDPAFLQVLKNVQQKVMEDAASGIPGASAMTFEQIVHIARNDFIRASYPTLMPFEVIGPQFVNGDASWRSRTYNAVAPTDVVKAQESGTRKF